MVNMIKMTRKEIEKGLEDGSIAAANTIEEKIVRLHQEKRDLANSLLEGADVSTRISAEELLELIRSA